MERLKISDIKKNVIQWEGKGGKGDKKVEYIILLVSIDHILRKMTITVDFFGINWLLGILKYDH